MAAKAVKVCLTPALYRASGMKSAETTVVVDILRATTAMCEAFRNGAAAILPVATVEEAVEYKRKGFLVAGEREGVKLDFADFGNDPLEFTREKVAGATIAFTTTNGTRAIEMAKGRGSVVLGSFLNISALTEWLVGRNEEVRILCAGWKDQFSLEDTVFAGALAERLIKTGHFGLSGDEAAAAVTLWEQAEPDLPGFMQQAEHLNRLQELGMTGLEYCFRFDTALVVPGLAGIALADLLSGDAGY